MAINVILLVNLYFFPLRFSSKFLFFQNKIILSYLISSAAAEQNVATILMEQKQRREASGLDLSKDFGLVETTTTLVIANELCGIIIGKVGMNIRYIKQVCVCCYLLGKVYRNQFECSLFLGVFFLLYLYLYVKKIKQDDAKMRRKVKTMCIGLPHQKDVPGLIGSLRLAFFNKETFTKVTLPCLTTQDPLPFLFCYLERLVRTLACMWYITSLIIYLSCSGDI